MITSFSVKNKSKIKKFCSFYILYMNTVSPFFLLYIILFLFILQTMNQEKLNLKYLMRPNRKKNYNRPEKPETTKDRKCCIVYWQAKENKQRQKRKRRKNVFQITPTSSTAKNGPTRHRASEKTQNQRPLPTTRFHERRPRPLPRHPPVSPLRLAIRHAMEFTHVRLQRSTDGSLVLFWEINVVWSNERRILSADAKVWVRVW